MAIREGYTLLQHRRFEAMMLLVSAPDGKGMFVSDYSQFTSLRLVKYLDEHGAAIDRFGLTSRSLKVFPSLLPTIQSRQYSHRIFTVGVIQPGLR